MEEEDDDEDEAGYDQRYPFTPSPGKAGILTDEAAYDRAEDGAHEGGVCEDGESIDALHGRPEVGNRAPSAGERGGTEEACDEAES